MAFFVPSALLYFTVSSKANPKYFEDLCSDLRPPSSCLDELVGDALYSTMKSELTPLELYFAAVIVVITDPFQILTLMHFYKTTLAHFDKFAINIALVAMSSSVKVCKFFGRGDI